MSRTRGARSLLASVFLLVLAAGTGCMPIFDPPEAPGLSKGEAKSVLACQDTINHAGRKFVEAKMQQLESCALDILKVRLAYENELIDFDKYEAQLPKLRSRCNENFRHIEKASTRFVNKVISACEPVEEWILDWDSLSFLVLEDEIDSSGFEFNSVEELAGHLCGVKEILVDQMIFFQMPRLMELLFHLGDEYVVIVDENDFLLGYPNIPLDERCIIDGGLEALL